MTPVSVKGCHLNNNNKKLIGEVEKSVINKPHILKLCRACKILQTRRLPLPYFLLALGNVFDLKRRGKYAWLG